mgnify:CR=1 FL=1
MEPRDAVKLAYQSEFAGGHLIRDRREGLLQRLDVLRALAREGRLPFGRAAAERYLMDYAAQGYPPLSHSQAYRAAYRPAYRVVEAGLLPDP